MKRLEIDIATRETDDDDDDDDYDEGFPHTVAGGGLLNRRTASYPSPEPPLPPKAAINMAKEVTASMDGLWNVDQLLINGIAHNL